MLYINLFFAVAALAVSCYTLGRAGGEPRRSAAHQTEKREEKDEMKQQWENLMAYNGERQDK